MEIIELSAEELEAVSGGGVFTSGNVNGGGG